MESLREESLTRQQEREADQQLALRLIDIGYKVLAKELHPDKGGSRDAMALHFLYYNFVRIHKTLRTTPAMAASVTDRLWEMSDIVNVLEAWEAGQ